MNQARIATLLIDAIAHEHTWQVLIHGVKAKELLAWSLEAQAAGWKVDTTEKGDSRWTDLHAPGAHSSRITLFHAERPDA